MYIFFLNKRKQVCCNLTSEEKRVRFRFEIEREMKINILKFEIKKKNLFLSNSLKFLKCNIRIKHKTPLKNK